MEAEPGLRRLRARRCLSANAGCGNAEVRKAAKAAAVAAWPQLPKAVILLLVAADAAALLAPPGKDMDAANEQQQRCWLRDHSEHS